MLSIVALNQRKCDDPIPVTFGTALTHKSIKLRKHRKRSNMMLLIARLMYILVILSYISSYLTTKGSKLSFIYSEFTNLAVVCFWKNLYFYSSVCFFIVVTFLLDIGLYFTNVILQPENERVVYSTEYKLMIGHIVYLLLSDYSILIRNWIKPFHGLFQYCSQILAALERTAYNLYICQFCSFSCTGLADHTFLCTFWKVVSPSFNFQRIIFSNLIYSLNSGCRMAELSLKCLVSLISLRLTACNAQSHWEHLLECKVSVSGYKITHNGYGGFVICFHFRCYACQFIIFFYWKPFKKKLHTSIFIQNIIVTSVARRRLHWEFPRYVKLKYVQTYIAIVKPDSSCMLQCFHLIEEYLLVYLVGAASVWEIIVFKFHRYNCSELNGRHKANRAHLLWSWN